MSQKFYSIKCTNCASPLDILGGGRVSTITCKYCKSILDLNDNYSVLAQYQASSRPDSEFQIGMRGFVRGIEWVIIGMIEYVSTDSPTERRLDFFLYSQLYGYAWLTEEDEGLYFSKRVRNFSIYDWEAKGKPATNFYNGGHYVRKEPAYFMAVNYVEGELSWVAKQSDVTEYTDFYGANQKSLTIERNKSEIESYHTVRLNKELITKSFILADKDSSKLIQNDPEDEVYERFPSYIRRGALVVSLLLGIFVVLSFLLGDTIFRSAAGQKQIVRELNIKHSDFLGKITIDAKQGANLSNFAMSLSRLPSNRLHFSINSKQVYLSTSNLKGTWQSDDDNVIVHLKLKKGKYVLRANIPAGVTLEIKEEVVRLTYVLPLFIASLLFLIHLYSGEVFGKIIKYGVSAVIIVSLFVFNVPIQISMIIGFFLYVFLNSSLEKGGGYVSNVDWGVKRDKETYTGRRSVWGNDWRIYD